MGILNIKTGQDGETDEEGKVSIDRDLNLIEGYISKNPDTRLLVIDPITDFSGRTDINDETAVRRMIGHLNALARKHALAVVIVAHLNKKEQLGATRRTLGAVGFQNTCRSSWLFAEHPDDPTQYVMVPTKCNYAAKQSGIAYRIVDRDGVGVAECTGTEVSLTADDALAKPRMSGHRSERKVDRASHWLLANLRDGPRPHDDLYTEADEAGISEATLKRARKQVGVKSMPDGFGGKRLLYIPDHSGVQDTASVGGNDDSHCETLLSP